MDDKIRKWIFWFFVCWNIFLFYLLLTPGSHYKRVYLFEGEDKIVHAILFSVWTFCLSFLLKKNILSEKRIVMFGLAGALFLAAATELAQLFVPNRTAGVSDFVADSVGAVAGVLAMILLKKELNRTRKKLDN